MNNYLIDTNILSMFLRNDNIVVENFRKNYLNNNTPIISIFTYYEIISGLKYRDSKNILEKFNRMTNYLKIINATIKSIEISADIYADLRSKGIKIDEVDIFISGICLAENLIFITNNEKHYSNVNNLRYINWSKTSN